MSGTGIAGRNTGCTKLLVALALLLFSGPARAQGETGTRTLSPYFFVEGGDAGVDRLPLLGTHVTVNVAGVIAEVTVRQTYKNDGPRPIHARYVFPASTRAAVHGLTMTIGTERVVARIKERGAAHKEFVAAKRAGKNAALLEEQRPNVFTMDVANLMPGQQVDVELEYSELLVPTAGVYEFVYPTVVGPRYASASVDGARRSDAFIHTPYTHAETPPLYSLALEGVVNAGLPVQELTSPTHELATRWSDPSRIQFALAADAGAGGNHDFVLHYKLEGERMQSGLMLYRGPEENFFLATIQPPSRVTLADIPPREYIFVVDVSGSMMGFPLETSKALLSDLIGHLRPSDTFDVLLFSGGSQLLSPRPVAATAENVARAVALIDRQQGGGGTELLAAMQRALALPESDDARSRSILLITDGYIGAEREVFTTIRANLGRANVFAFGIGSSVNRYLIEGIAHAGNGEPFVAMSPEQAPVSAARFREYVQSPLLTHVQVAFDGFDAYDVQPAAIPDVMAERPVVVIGKWRGAPGGRVVVTGQSGSGEYERSLDVSAAAPDPANRVLRYLWARTKIAELSDAGDGPESDEAKRELVALGLNYNLLTRHTSFIAVRELIVNPLGDGTDVAQPLPLPEGVADTAVGSMGMGDEPGLALLLSLLLAAGLCVWLRRQVPAVVQ